MQSVELTKAEMARTRKLLRDIAARRAHLEWTELEAWRALECVLPSSSRKRGGRRAGAGQKPKDWRLVAGRTLPQLGLEMAIERALHPGMGDQPTLETIIARRRADAEMDPLDETKLSRRAKDAASALKDSARMAGHWKVHREARMKDRQANGALAPRDGDDVSQAEQELGWHLAFSVTWQGSGRTGSLVSIGQEEDVEELDARERGAQSEA